MKVAIVAGSNIGACGSQASAVILEFVLNRSDSIHKSITVNKDRYKEVLTHLQEAVCPACPT